MAGELFDVWFLPTGRNRLRRKVSVTLSPSSWAGSMGVSKLDSLVREEFHDLLDARSARLVVTSRPEEAVVVEIRWSG